MRGVMSCSTASSGAVPAGKNGRREIADELERDDGLAVAPINGPFTGCTGAALRRTRREDDTDDRALVGACIRNTGRFLLRGLLEERRTSTTMVEDDG
jgi:hypothetical protein